jgi:hypothetical protein
VSAAPRTGRYLWYRNNAAANVICPMLDASSPASCTSAGFAYLHIAEIAAYATRCASLSNLGLSAGSSIESGQLDGCGAATPGALNSSSVWTGSTCTQSCAAGTTRIRGGTPTSSKQTLRCAAGEWLNDATLSASGPHVCGVACPSLGPPAWTSASTCVHIAAQESFDGPPPQVLTDWYPMWRVFKVASAAPMPLSAMEYRAVIEDGVLKLSGQRTLFGLNEPRWASSPSSTLSISADVKFGSNASVVGLALRIQPGTEPASFYLLKLVADAGAEHQIVRVANGTETSLASTVSSACPMSTGGFQRVRFWSFDAALIAFCNGTLFMYAVEFNVLALPAVGSAGVYADNPTRSVNASAVIDDVLVERSCDNGVCSGALPGERCSWQCAFAPAPAAASAMCQPDGTWIQASACPVSPGACVARCLCGYPP